MAKTNLQRKLSYYKRVIEEGKNSPHSQSYGEVSAALNKLVEISKIFLLFFSKDVIINYVN